MPKASEKHNPPERPPSQQKGPKAWPKGRRRRTLFSKIGGAALAAAIAIHAHAAVARQLPRKYGQEPPKPAETPGKPGEWRGEASGRVETSSRYARSGEEETFIINYRDISGRENGVPISLSMELGVPLQVFPGPERTVVFTDKAILITQGYNSCFRGELFVPMEDRATTSSTVMVPLPDDSSGDKLSAYTRAVGQSEDVVYFLNSSGTVRSRRVSTMGGVFSEAVLEPMQGAALATAGHYAVAYALGSDFAYVLLHNEGGEMLAGRIELSGPVSSAPCAEPVGNGLSIRFGSQRFSIMRSIRGGRPELVVVEL